VRCYGVCLLQIVGAPGVGKHQLSQAIVNAETNFSLHVFVAMLCHYSNCKLLLVVVVVVVVVGVVALAVSVVIVVAVTWPLHVLLYLLYAEQ